MPPRRPRIKAFLEWRKVKPTDRAALMRKVSAVIRANAEEFALIDSLNCGNPLTALRRDIGNAAAAIDYFAGLVLQVHGRPFRSARTS